MNCQDFEKYLIDYFEEDLDKAQCLELVAHTESCESCRREFEAYQLQEQQLRKYFELRTAQAMKMENPVPVPAAKVVDMRPVHLRRAAWAVAALLMVGLSLGVWSIYRDVVPTGSRVLASAKMVEGKVLLFSEKGSELLVAGGTVRQDQKVKVANGGYLALELPDGNIIEARGGTQFRLRDYPQRLEVAMGRGEVWAHLNTPPEKRFEVVTAHLRAVAVGTIFHVQEALDSSVVTVAKGTVGVEYNGQLTEVTPLQAFSSEYGVERVAYAVGVAWSQFQGNLGNVMAPREAGGESVTPVLSVEQVGASASRSLPAVSRSIAAFLPRDTLYLFLIHDWEGQIQEFHGTDYQALLNEPAVREWWNSVGGQKVLDEFLSESRLFEVLEIAKLLRGQAAVSVTADGEFLVLADCKGNEMEVQGRINLFREEEMEAKGIEYGEDVELEMDKHVMVIGERLVISSSAELLTSTRDGILMNQATGFQSSEFYMKVTGELSANPRFLFAVNLKGQVSVISDKQGIKDDPEADAAFKLMGLTSIDYLLLSPGFSGRGMNQAARLAFGEEGRKGAMNWLAEPAPMRGLDFFAPDIPFFISAIARNPYQVMLDYLEYVEAAQPEESFLKTLDFTAKNQEFFDSFGGEIAIGIDRPILPVPNLKIAIEIADPRAFRVGFDKLIDAWQDELLRQGLASTLEFTEHRGRVIQTLIVDTKFIKMRPSWAFIDDFLIAGPGPQYLRHSIDVYESGHSIANDSQRMLPLLPSREDMNFSFLAYQDVAQLVPDLLNHVIGLKSGLGDFVKLPDFGFIGDYRAPSVAYGFARKDCIDLHFSAPDGLDLNFGLAAPFMAKWLMPRTDIGAVVGKVAEAQVVLDAAAVQVRIFVAKNGRLPKSIEEMYVSPEPRGALEPVDPFDADGLPVRLVLGAEGQLLTLYSIGPDGVDDGAGVEYKVGEKYDGPGDIIVQLSLEELLAGSGIIAE